MRHLILPNIYFGKELSEEILSNYDMELLSTVFLMRELLKKIVLT